jgi:hypothetical protein
MLETHLVLRSFTGAGGRQFQPGDRVAAEDWRLRPALEAQRRIRRLTPQDLEGPAGPQTVATEGAGKTKNKGKGA